MVGRPGSWRSSFCHLAPEGFQCWAFGDSRELGGERSREHQGEEESVVQRCTWPLGTISRGLPRTLRTVCSESWAGCGIVHSSTGQICGHDLQKVAQEAKKGLASEASLKLNSSSPFLSHRTRALSLCGRCLSLHLYDCTPPFHHLEGEWTQPVLQMCPPRSSRHRVTITFKVTYILLQINTVSRVFWVSVGYVL